MCGALFNGCAYLTRASETQQGVSPPGENRSPDLSADGRYVAFESDATYDAGDTGLFTDVFVRDNVTRSVVRVSVTSNGDPANGSSFDASITPTGRFVAFASAASNLAPVDTNGATDVFWHDRDADADGIFDEPGAIRTVAVSAGAGITGNGQSSHPSVTERGGQSLVAFQSLATNLPVSPPDTNGVEDVFYAVIDVATGQPNSVFTVSYNRVQGEEANGPSRQPDIRLDSDLLAVAYVTAATNLTPLYGDTNGHDDVVVWFCFGLGCDSRRATYLAPQPNDEQFMPRLVPRSGNPPTARVVYASRATNLAPGDPTTGGEVDVFMSDFVLGGTTALSRTAAGFEPNGSSFNPSASSDGTRVAFESDASNLVGGDTNGTTDVFVRAAPGFTQRVSTSALLAEADAGSEAPSISADGAYVAFTSRAGNLRTPDTNPAADVFVRAAVVPEIDSVMAVDPNTQAEIPPVLHFGANELVVRGRGFGSAITGLLGDGVTVSVLYVDPAELRLQAVVAPGTLPGTRTLSVSNLGTGLGVNAGALQNCTNCVQIGR
jgi:hypothetical protein